MKILRGWLARWIRRRQGEDRLPLLLERRRLYILPTRAGIGFGLLLALMLVAGFNYANSLALLFTFLLIGFCLVTMHQCHRNLLHVQLSAAVAPPVFASAVGTVIVTFENPSAFARYRIAAGVGDTPTVDTDIAAAGRCSIQLPVAAPQRGLQRLDRLRLVTRHPFGLFRAWTWVYTPMELMVYPRPQGSLPMPAETGRKAGQRAAVAVGSDEWQGLRPFRDGDSPRQVDWKAYARSAPLLVKEYNAAGADLRVFDFAALARLATEERLEQLTRWIVDAEAGGERYGLVLPELSVPIDRGPDHRHRCLSALALFPRSR